MGLGCETLESLNYSNFNDDICYVSAYSRAPLTGFVTMRRIPVVAPDTGSFPLGQMFSGQREKQDGFNTTGKVNSSSLGNEIVSDINTSITFRADTVYNALNPSILPPRVNRNTLVAFLEGTGIDADGTYEELISVSGARLTCPVDVTSAKWALYNEGYFVIDGKKKNSSTGKPELRKNPYIDKYNKTDICTMMELYVAPTVDTTNDVTYRFPFVTSNNITFAEGTDANKFSVDCMFIADRRNTLQPIADGFSDNEVDATTTGGASSTTAYKLNLEFIAFGNLTGTPTYATGVTGQSIAVGTLIGVIDNTSTSAVTLDVYKNTGTALANGAVWTAIDQSFGLGFSGWTNNVVTDLACVTDTSGMVAGDTALMAISTAGANGSALVATYGTNVIIPIKDLVTDSSTRSTLWENHNVL